MSDDKKPEKPDVTLNDIKKYVRTFERDQATVQTGAHPDLVPFGTPLPEVKTPVVVPQPKEEKPSVPPAASPVPKPAIEQKPKVILPPPPTPKPLHEEIPKVVLPPPPQPKIEQKPKPVEPPPLPPPVVPPKPPVVEVPPQVTVSKEEETPKLEPHVPELRPPKLTQLTQSINQLERKASSPSANAAQRSVDEVLRPQIDFSKITPVYRTYQRDLTALQGTVPVPQPPVPQADTSKSPLSQTKETPKTAQPQKPAVPLPPLSWSQEKIVAPPITFPAPPQAEVREEHMVVPARGVVGEEHIPSREEILARLREKAQASSIRKAPPLIPADIPAKFLAEERSRREIRQSEVDALVSVQESDNARRRFRRPSERLIAGSPFASVESDSYVSEPAPNFERSRRETEESASTRIHTYTSDFSDRLQDTQASTMSVLAAGADAGQLATAPEPVRHTNLFLLIGSLVLIIGSVTSAYIVNNYRQSHPAVVAPTEVVMAPIFVDDRIQVSGTGTTLRAAVIQQMTASLSPHSVRLLYTGIGTTTQTNLFSALQLPAPDVLLRNLYAKGSVAGIINAEGAQNPFFILAVSSYKETFAGMLAWEPRIVQDLRDLYPGYVAAQPATSTPGSNTYLLIGFRDEVIANHDVRVYRDAAGRSVLLYGYWNSSTLVIARDEGSFTELINRLGSSQTGH